MSIIPNLKWYATLSVARGVSVRCPFATVDACPRYYQSLSLLGNAAGTPIAPNEDARLLSGWKETDLWPQTKDQETAVVYVEGKPYQYSQVCPEVAFDRFGFFVTYLARYADEIDSGVAHDRLAGEHVSQDDPRWVWQSATPQHYTECPIYAVLAHRAKGPTSTLPDPAVVAEPPSIIKHIEFFRLYWRSFWKHIVIAGIVLAAISIVPALDFKSIWNSIFGTPAEVVAPQEVAEPRTKLRKERSLRNLLDTEDDRPVSQLPNGIYGFVTPWSDPHGDPSLSVRPGGTVTLEVHKLAGGEVHIVGYVNKEAAQQVASDASSGVIELYTRAWEEAPILVSLPVPRIASVQNRRFRNDYVLDIRLLPR